MKRYLKLIPILACALFCALGIVACAPAGLGDHRFSSEWNSNINYHWHACTDPGCNERGEYAKHNWVVTTVYENATCGTNGAGQYTCTDCKATLGNELYRATIPATGDHDYELVETIVEASCGRDGVGAFVCSHCYDYIIQPIPATGKHNYSTDYQTNQDGHYHVCLNGCKVDSPLEPHVMGEGIRFEPTGSQDGRIEYRCKECKYLMKTEPIENPNVLVRLEVRFTKKGTGTETTPLEVAPSYVDEYGELWVSLRTSSNAMSGYNVELTGYSASDAVVSTPTWPTIYYLDQYTGKTQILDMQHGGDATTGYIGYIKNAGLYVSRATEDECILIECERPGRESITLKVHITTKTLPDAASVSLLGEVALVEDKKNY